MTYKRRAEFSNADDYAVYVRENILAGMKVRCCQTYEEVAEGDVGTVVKVSLFLIDSLLYKVYMYCMSLFICCAYPNLFDLEL